MWTWITSCYDPAYTTPWANCFYGGIISLYLMMIIGIIVGGVLEQRR